MRELRTIGQAISQCSWSDSIFTSLVGIEWSRNLGLRRDGSAPSRRSPDSALSRKDRTSEHPLRLDVSAGESISPPTPQADSGPSRCRLMEWATLPVHPSPHRPLYRPWKLFRPSRSVRMYSLLSTARFQR